MFFFFNKAHPRLLQHANIWYFLAYQIPYYLIAVIMTERSLFLANTILLTKQILMKRLYLRQQSQFIDHLRLLFFNYISFPVQSQQRTEFRTPLVSSTSKPGRLPHGSTQYSECTLNITRLYCHSNDFPLPPRTESAKISEIRSGRVKHTNDKVLTRFFN